jgi:hypothetical protein
MNLIFSNRYVNALARTIVFFGIVHLAILGLIAVRGNIDVLNAFNILDLDSFIPGLTEGLINFILSYLMVLVVYCLAYRYFTKHTDKTKPETAG